MESLARRGIASAKAQLAGPPLPREYADVWALFCDLDRWRGTGMMGLAPLTLHDLAAYEARFGFPIGPDVADLVKRLDFVRLAASQPAKETKR